MLFVGTFISGGTNKIAVFSGNTHVSVQDETDTGHIVEQMWPLHTYGTHFAVMPNPIRLELTTYMYGLSNSFVNDVLWELSIFWVKLCNDVATVPALLATN